MNFDVIEKIDADVGIQKIVSKLCRRTIYIALEPTNKIVNRGQSR